MSSRSCAEFGGSEGEDGDVGGAAGGITCWLALCMLASAEDVRHAAVTPSPRTSAVKRLIVAASKLISHLWFQFDGAAVQA